MYWSSKACQSVEIGLFNAEILFILLFFVSSALNVCLFLFACIMRLLSALVANKDIYINKVNYQSYAASYNCSCYM